MEIRVKTIKLLSAIMLIGIWMACKDDDPELGPPPSASDAGFSFVESPETPNILIFSTNNPNVIAQWDFGNGTSAEGISVRGVFPNKGDYQINLTVFAKGGRTTSSQVVNIENDDPSLLANPLFTLLTGGIDSLNGKTWVVDSANTAHFGVGPNPIGAGGEYPEWYAAGPLEKQGAGFYDDRFNFKLSAFEYNQYTQGNIYVNAEHKDDFPGAVESPVSDFIGPFPNQTGKSWTITETADDTIITVSGGSFIGYYTGVSSYSVVKFTENELFLRQLDTKNSGLAWYVRLIREGYVPSGGGPPGGGSGATLPIDFEGDDPGFESFGGSTDTIVDNFDKRGINFSDKILETVHGVETWAGVSVELASKLNFNSENKIAVKVFAQTFGDTLLVKLEDKNNSSAFVEKKVAIPVAFNWVEVEVQFDPADSDLYDKLALFPGWNRSNAGTFYLDDITQK